MARPVAAGSSPKAALAMMLPQLAPARFAPSEGSAARAACSSHLHVHGQTDWLCPADPASAASSTHLHPCGQSIVVSLSAPCKWASQHHVLQGWQLALVHSNGGTARILWGAWGWPDASRGVPCCGSLCPPAGMLALLSWLAMEPRQHLVLPLCLTNGTAGVLAQAHKREALRQTYLLHLQISSPGSSRLSVPQQTSLPVAVQVVSHTLEVVPHKLRPGHSIQQRQV